MKFENYAGSAQLALNNTQGYAYTNANGDQFNVSTYKYYISNIKFVGSDGKEYAEPESYHFLDQADPASLSFTISDIPAGTYTTVKMVLGVDSARNVSGAQTGALDPIHGMFWTWSSGYIMAKIEGNFLKTSTSASSGFSLHLGGFTGKYSVVNEITLPLPQNLVVGDNTTSSVTLKSDALKWFESPNLINLNDLNQVGSAGADASRIAQNFSRAFTVTQVQN